MGFVNNVVANRIFASSLFILFSSSSLARAFLRSAMNCTRPVISGALADIPDHISGCNVPRIDDILELLALLISTLDEYSVTDRDR